MTVPVLSLIHVGEVLPPAPTCMDSAVTPGVPIEKPPALVLLP
jgi:hypothetical protein